MSAELTQYLPFIIGAVVLALIAVFVLLRANRRARVITDQSKRDVLDEGAAPAQRNQALIDAPRATEPAPVIVPTLATVPASAPISDAPADDLTRIKGLGAKLAGILAEQGITRFAQIAAWSEDDIARMDANLGRFAGRITRDHWVEQAKLLESGDESGFAEKFGQST
jgi:predicted flap endonuclease-1-like 5' DNA nuclease